MNENRKANKFIAIINLVEKRFANMNKGSKLIMKIASFVLPIVLIGAVIVMVSEMTGLIRLENQGEMIQWLILYGFRAWVLLFCGALILDYLKGGAQKE